MTILSLKDFMKKYNLKMILRLKVIYKEFIIIKYILDIQKYIQTKDL